jgi:hypothetical protein
VAQSCPDLLNAAKDEEWEASQAVNKSHDQFGEVKRWSSSNAPDAELCAVGQQARQNGVFSTWKLKAARASWLLAIQACPSPLNEQTAKQADNKTVRHNQQVKFLVDMDTLLARCNFTPLLFIPDQ